LRQDADAELDDEAFETRRRVLLETEGSVKSAVLEGLSLPVGGVTTMDIMTAANLARHVPTVQSPRRWSCSSADSAAAGAPATPTSVVINVSVPQHIVAAAREGFEHLEVRVDDTRASLLCRLAASTLLDDIQVPKKGRGKDGRTERLNASAKPQPRRASFSVLGSAPFVRSGRDVQMLFNYTSYRRAERNHVAKPMTPGMFDLGLHLWLVARAHMDGSFCAETPWTHVQILWYYQVFGSKMAQHRDNSNARDFASYMAGRTTGPSVHGHCASHAQENSQAPNSWVAVFTLGTGVMTCKLRFAPHRDLECPRKEYIIHPSFCFPLGPGTMFLMSPIDDLCFTHEAEFEFSFCMDEMLGVGGSEWREAWVWRHLGSLQCFYTAIGANLMFPSEEIVGKERVRKKNRAKKRVAARRQLMWSSF
jgi:hypothetical protein